MSSDLLADLISSEEICSHYRPLWPKYMERCDLRPNSPFKCMSIECGLCRPEKEICSECRQEVGVHKACDQFEAYMPDICGTRDYSPPELKKWEDGCRHCGLLQVHHGEQAALQEKMNSAIQVNSPSHPNVFIPHFTIGNQQDVPLACRDCGRPFSHHNSRTHEFVRPGQIFKS